MSGAYATISGPDGSFSAYLVAPKTHRGPGLLVMQEMFGVNGFMRHACETFARAGYFTLCPDLYWRQTPGVDLSDGSEAEMEQAFSLLEGLDPDTAVEDLKVAMAHLAGIGGCSGRIGGVGYCLGGLLAYLMMCRSEAACAIGYYGVNIHEHLGEARRDDAAADAACRRGRPHHVPRGHRRHDGGPRGTSPGDDSQLPGPRSRLCPGRHAVLSLRRGGGPTWPTADL